MRRTLLIITVVLLGAFVAAGLLFFKSSSAPPPELRGQVETFTLESGGRPRKALRYTPASLPPDAPLLLVLHGTGQDGAAVRAATGFEFDRLADLAGFSVLYPDGIGRQWNDCRPKAAADAAIDDVGFLERLIAREGRPGVKVFAFGYSNGGQMVLRLISDRPELLAGGALSGANLPTDAYFTCTLPARLPPMLVSNGTADPIVPFAGGHVSIFGVIDRGDALSADATAQVLVDHGTTDAMEERRPAPGVLQRTWGSRVEQLVFEGAGHTIPQPRFQAPPMLGPTPTWNVPEEVVRFFGLR